VASENVEIVKRLYESFRTRDNEAPFEYYAEDIVWDARTVKAPGLQQVYRGHDGVRAFWRAWLEAWEEIEVDTDEPVELGDGRVKVRVRQRNRGRETGIWIEQDPYDAFWTLEGGKVVRVEFAWAAKD
jgi:ketosteroid isomerase-like protein